MSVARVQWAESFNGECNKTEITWKPRPTRDRHLTSVVADWLGFCFIIIIITLRGSSIINCWTRRGHCIVKRCSPVLRMDYLSQCRSVRSASILLVACAPLDTDLLIDKQICHDPQTHVLCSREVYYHLYYYLFLLIREWERPTTWGVVLK